MSRTDAGTSHEADSLFARAQGGDRAAWDALIELSYERIRRVVSRRLDPPMRSLYDSTDFANDVFKSLVAKSDRFDFATYNDLVSHLAKAAKQKVIDEYRKQHAQKRDIRVTAQFDALRGPDGDGFEPVALDPSPSQVAQARDVEDQLFAGQNAEEVEAIKMKAVGFSNEQIAKHLHQHPRKIQRFFKRVHDSFYPSGDASS
jgi:RNA polymerase sigma-70 factor (ECF subfamily)